MLIIGLMVIAVICLVVGLVLPSSAWLVASLIATAGAGYLVWKMRTAIAAVPGVSTAAASTGGAPAPSTAGGSGAGRSAAPSRSADTEDDQPPAAPADDATQVIPAVDDTAVLAAIRPDDPALVGNTAPEGANASTTGGGPPLAEVWVIDGRPRYHVGNCPIIQGQDAEPIPFDQAVEDGFMPCSLCEPNVAQPSR